MRRNPIGAFLTRALLAVLLLLQVVAPEASNAASPALRQAVALSSPDRLMFAGTRLSIATLANPAVTSGYEVQYSRVLVGTPDYAIRDLWLYYPNWRRQQNAASPTEVSPGNSITVAGSIKVGATYYPITFGGSSSPYVLADGAGAWANVQVYVPAGSTIYINTESQVAVGGVRIGISRPYTNQGEGITHVAATDSGYLDGSKTPSGTGAGGHTYAYAPTMMVARGWDRRDVVLLTGDSIAAGHNDDVIVNRSFDARGNMGAWQRGLDSQTGGRIPFGVVAVPGLTTLLDDSTSDLAKTLAMLEDPIFGVGAAYRPPFTTIVSNMGVNDFGSSTGATVYPTMKANVLNRIAFYKSRYPFAPWVQSTLSPRANTTTLYNWADPTQQQPVGTDGTSPNGRWAFNDDLRAKNVAGVDVLIDFEPYYSDPTNRDRWPATATFALTVQANSGQTHVTVPVAPEIGESLTLDPGVSGKAENRQVFSYTGTGPYDVTLNSNLTNTHLVGAIVVYRNSDDGVHPLTGTAIRATGAVFIHKASATLH